MDTPKETNRNTKLKKWFKRFGVVGFLFFFIKGLVWLAVFFGIAKCVY